jgi:hypothetical protein
MSCVECSAAGAAVDRVEPAVSSPPLDRGIAGRSARTEYERRSTKRIAEIDRTWGRFAGVVKALTDEPDSTRAWAIGAEGEEELARRLAQVDGLQVLNDRRVPGTKGNIDHIVIARAGVFVVDAKQMKGRIEIKNVGWFWKPDYRLYVGRRDKTGLVENMAWQVDAVRSALGAAGLDPLPPITPVLCFIDGDWPLFGGPDAFNGVRLEGPRSIKTLVTASAILEADVIELFARILAAALPST